MGAGGGDGLRGDAADDGLDRVLGSPLLSSALPLPSSTPHPILLIAYSPLPTTPLPHTLSYSSHTAHYPPLPHTLSYWRRHTHTHTYALTQRMSYARPGTDAAYRVLVLPPYSLTLFSYQTAVSSYHTPHPSYALVLATYTVCPTRTDTVAYYATRNV
eukprot:2307585-Rhodomonas_salina.1